MNRIISNLILMVFIAFLSTFKASGQCPTLLDGQGNAVETLTLANCSGGGMIFISAGADWSAFSVDWGDGSNSESFADGLLSGGYISHEYPITPAVYTAVWSLRSPRMRRFRFRSVA
jgi:hypothetical protein